MLPQPLKKAIETALKPLGYEIAEMGTLPKKAFRFVIEPKTEEGEFGAAYRNKRKTK